MSVYELDEDEAVILQATGVYASNGSVDLILTNKNIIQINMGFWGNPTNSDKYPLDDIRILNGKPNIIIGKYEKGSKCLEIFLMNGKLGYKFKGAFEINKWANAIEKAHKDRMAEIKKSQKGDKGTLADSVKGTIERLIPTKNAQSKYCKCSRCGAELTGLKGEQVTCDYCNNIVVIK